MKSDLRGTGIWNQLQSSKILILLGILLLIPVVWWIQGREAAHSVTQTASRKEKTAVPPSSADLVSIVPKLQEPRPEFKLEKRNIFSFHTEPPAPPAEVPNPEEEMAASENELPQAVCGNQACEEGEDNQNCPTDCGPPPPPEISLRYIGYLSEQEGEVAFLTDGKEVFMGRVNDIIANKYRILNISDESVELGYLNLNQSRSIPFQGSGRS